MDFFKPETFVYTEKGIQMVKDGLQNLRPFKLTDTQENIKKNVGKDTSAGGMIVFKDPTTNDGTSQVMWEKNVQKDFISQDRGKSKAELLVSHAQRIWWTNRYYDFRSKC